MLLWLPEEEQAEKKVDTVLQGMTKFVQVSLGEPI